MSYDRLRGAFKQAWKRVEQQEWTYGLLGRHNSDSTITYQVPGRSNFLYVAIRNAAGSQTVTVARNDAGVPWSADLPLRMYQDRDGNYVIESVYGGSGLTTPPATSPSGVPPHLHDSRYFTETEFTGAADLGAPADTDKLLAVRGGLGTLSWSGLKAALTTLFNGLYVTLTGAQTVAGEKKFTDNMGLGTTTDPIATLHITQTDDYESYTDSRGLTGTVAALMNLIYTISSYTGTLFGLFVDTKYNLSANPASAKIGNSLTGLATVPLGNATTLTNLTLRGVNFIAQHSGTGVLGALVGALGFATNNQAGAVTNAIGFAPGVQNQHASGVITNAYALQITNFTNAGTIANTYGIWVGDLSAGTQTNVPYSIYLMDENTYNYIAGRLGLGNGNATPQGPLHIHDGVGGWLFVTKTSVNGTAQVIIPNAAGDCVRGAMIEYVAWDGTTFAGAAGIVIANGGTHGIVVGTSTYTVTINANGEMSIARTAGAGTLTSINLGIRWL